MNGDVRGEMVLGLVLLERRQLTGRHPEDHAALHVPLDADVVALRESIHFGSSAVDNHIDRRETGRELIGEVGAQPCPVTRREGRCGRDGRHERERRRECRASKRWHQSHEKLPETGGSEIVRRQAGTPRRESIRSTARRRVRFATPVAHTINTCSSITTWSPTLKWFTVHGPHYRFNAFRTGDRSFC